MALALQMMNHVAGAVIKSIVCIDSRIHVYLKYRWICRTAKVIGSLQASAGNGVLPSPPVLGASLKGFLGKYLSVKFPD
jgi:hypothetical protein